jgi:hypothetical protein
MFHRVNYHDWQLVFPVLALLTALAVTALVAGLVVRLTAPRCERLARLPLEDDPPLDAHE